MPAAPAPPALWPAHPAARTPRENRNPLSENEPCPWRSRPATEPAECLSSAQCLPKSRLWKRRQLWNRASGYRRHRSPRQALCRPNLATPRAARRAPGRKAQPARWAGIPASLFRASLMAHFRLPAQRRSRSFRGHRRRWPFHGRLPGAAGPGQTRPAGHPSPRKGVPQYRAAHCASRCA